MNLIEAIQNCGENWFRTVEMRSTEYAYMFDNDGFLRLVTHCRITGRIILSERAQAFLHYKSDFLCEWEIVTPEQVMKERK